MQHVRFNLITADPARLPACVRYIEGEVRPEVERCRGSLGLSLHVNVPLGVAVLESFWATDEALRLSEQPMAPARRAAVQRAAGTVTVERYRAPVFELDARLHSGAGIRLMRMQAARWRIEDAIETFGDTVVPWLAETDGFCGALLLADRACGQLVSECMWRDIAALEASRSLAAKVRVRVAEDAGCAIRAVEEHRLVFSSARKA